MFVLVVTLQQQIRDSEAGSLSVALLGLEGLTAGAELPAEVP